MLATAIYKQTISLAPNQIAAHPGLTKFDMAKYAESLTYQDPEDSRRSIDSPALALAQAEMRRAA